MIKIALCIKQVPDTNDIRWTEHNTIHREGVESIINPYDVYALEFALKIKQELKDVSITVFSMGPKQAQNIISRAIALGADDGVLISDKKFAGSDTYATALILSKAIEKVLPDYDLVICGQFATDGDTAQTPPNIATFLNIAQVTFVKEFLKIEKESFWLKRELEDGLETVKVKSPAVIGVLKENFEPSRPRISGIITAAKKEIKVLGIDDLGLSSEQVGIKGSPTYVNKAFRKVTSHNATKYIQDTQKSVEMIRDVIKSTLGG